MPPPISRSQADKLLANRYPDDRTLQSFPLGESLVSVPALDTRFPGHMSDVIEGMNILLSKDFYKIVKSWSSLPQAPPEADKLRGAWNRIFERVGNQAPYSRFATSKDRNFFFRMLALYHDIGKSISLERHPTIGWHLIRDVEWDLVVERLYPLLLSINFTDWNKDLKRAGGKVELIVDADQLRLLKLFETTILYHDYFGVLSTGEASLPLAVDIVPLRTVDPADLQEIFSTLMIFNLADLYGSVPEVTPQMVDIFCSDWEVLCKAIEEVGGRRQAFLELLVDKAQASDNAMQRLWRLMYAGEKKKDQRIITLQAVEESFRDIAFPSLARFVKNFALFCKLDYCLGFKIKITREAKKSSNSVLSGINRMISLLVALESRYGDLCRRNDGTWRRLGVQMAALTRGSRGGDSKIAQTIAKLLLGPEGVGRAWAVGDCTVWFMED